MENISMDFDDVAWDKSAEALRVWKHRLYSDGVAHKVAVLAQKHRQGVIEGIKSPISGSNNVCLRVEFADGGSAMARFAVPGRAMFPDEKLRAEVAAMRFIADNTTIPLPLVLHVGRAEEGPGLGSFMILEYVDHDRAVADALNVHCRDSDQTPLLDPNIPDDTLHACYKQMAELLLKLSRPELPRIGSFAESGEFEWSVTERPLTCNMNKLVLFGDFPTDCLPIQTFDTASSYYLALADIHLDHLTAQHNDAIESEYDCRRKYVARYLFRKLAAEGRLNHFPEFENGPFKLFCEDLRPTSVLIKGTTVAGVVDWEYTIAAPAGFAFSPPWWLLLVAPDYWTWGMASWEKYYTKRLDTFLDILESVEQEAVERSIQMSEERTTEIPLSSRMRTSWETGAFWVDFAAQRSWAFDMVYFYRLDEKFFGKCEGDWLESRLPLLTEQQRQQMDQFVHRKMAQKADRKMPDDRFEKILASETASV